MTMSEFTIGDKVWCIPWEHGTVGSPQLCTFVGTLGENQFKQHIIEYPNGRTERCYHGRGGNKTIFFSREEAFDYLIVEMTFRKKDMWAEYQSVCECIAKLEREKNDLGKSSGL